MLELEDQNPPPPPPPNSWFLRHPYTSSVLGAGTLFLIGAYIVASNSLTSPPPPSISAWGGTIGSMIDANYVPPELREPPQEDILEQVQESPPYSYQIPNLKPDNPSSPQQPTPTTEIDLEAILTSLGEGEPRVGTAPYKWTSVIYEFPPSSIFSTTEQPSQRTEVQHRLYNYGNEVGSYIQSFEQHNANQTQILKDQLEDRSNPEKIESVERLGQALQNIGKNIKTIEDVPPEIAEAHTELSNSYIEIGYNLMLVPKAQNNNQLLGAIDIYNKSAENFAKKFVDMVTVFSDHGVTFTNDEAGSVFTFTFTSSE